MEGLSPVAVPVQPAFHGNPAHSRVLRARVGVQGMRTCGSVGAVLVVNKVSTLQGL